MKVNADVPTESRKNNFKIDSKTLLVPGLVKKENNEKARQL